MTPQQWGVIKAIFSSAIEMEIAARDQYVRDVAAGNEELIEEVLSLLRADSDGIELRNPLFTACSTTQDLTPAETSTVSHAVHPVQTTDSDLGGPKLPPGDSGPG